MDVISAVSRRGCDTLVEGLRAEFGAILAERIIDAEALDFIWEGRVGERYLGEHLGELADEEMFGEVSRVAVLSSIGCRWYVGMCLIDGEGDALELLWRRDFEALAGAEVAFERVH